MTDTHIQNTKVVLRIRLMADSWLVDKESASKPILKITLHRSI
jgi:hypothetical protein